MSSTGERISFNICWTCFMHGRDIPSPPPDMSHTWKGYPLISAGHVLYRGQDILVHPLDMSYTGKGYPCISTGHVSYRDRISFSMSAGHVSYSQGISFYISTGHVSYSNRISKCGGLVLYTGYRYLWQNPVSRYIPGICSVWYIVIYYNIRLNHVEL
jgi:hypothetical protein